MKIQTLKQLIRTWNRQGFFEGDLNNVQLYCLMWLLGDEAEERMGEMKLNVLAVNPEMYRAMFEAEQAQLAEKNWITPTDPEEAAKIEAQFQEILGMAQVGSDDV